MIYSIYDASGKLRFESTNWPVSRSLARLASAPWTKLRQKEKGR